MSWWEEHRNRTQWSFAHGIGIGYQIEKTVFPGPASQLIVASVALSKLGSDRRFLTQLLAKRLVGGDYELTLVGGGDPTLRYEDLLAMAQRLHDQGIKRVSGPLWVDETLFDGQRQGAGWFWDEESEPRQAQLSALSVDGNCALVCVSLGDADGDLVVDLGRAEGYLRVAEDVAAVGHRPQMRDDAKGAMVALQVARRRGCNIIDLSGVTDQPVTHRVTVDDPALYAGHLLLQALVEVGVALSDASIPIHGRAGGDCLVQHASALLYDIIAQHTPGQGSPLVYELLLKHLGSLGGHQGSSLRGLAVIDETMAPIIGTSYRLADGAGLCRYNQLSADQLVRLLEHLAHFQPELVELLPVSENGRVICTRGRSATGVVGYWGTECQPVALLTFGHVQEATDHDLLQAVESLLLGSSQGLLPTAPGRNEVAATRAVDQVDVDDDSLTADLDALLLDPLLHHGWVGMHVVEQESGRELYGHLPDATFTPASNTKLYSSAAALHYLGSEFRYQTPVYHRGQRYADGTWVGDLVVKGVGDPTLDQSVLRGWAEQLVRQGLRTLDGGVVVDDTAFTDGVLPHGWLASLEKFGYSPQISALSFNENVVTVTLYPGRQVEAPAVMEVAPLPGYLTIANRVRTCQAGGEEMVESSRQPYSNRVVLSGEIPLDHEPVERNITVEDPAVYFGYALLDALVAAGVRIRSERFVVKGCVAEQDQELFVHASPPMSKIVADLNKPSDNFYAEMVLRTIGLVIKGVGSAEAGIELVNEMLRSGGAENLPLLTDGSGLTRHNLFTPRQVTDLLRQMVEHPEYETYYASLPIAGIDGTLRKRMKTGYAYGNVRAKTGTMGGVSALSGYLRTADRRWLCFAILMNGYADQGAFVEMQNRIAERLARG